MHTMKLVSSFRALVSLCLVSGIIICASERTSSCDRQTGYSTPSKRSSSCSIVCCVITAVRQLYSWKLQTVAVSEISSCEAPRV